VGKAEGGNGAVHDRPRASVRVPHPGCHHSLISQLLVQVGRFGLLPSPRPRVVPLGLDPPFHCAGQ